MITLTEKAARQIQELVRRKGGGAEALRLSVENGGCSGMQYSLALGARREGDQIVTRDGASLLIDPESLRYVGDSVIDYDDSLSGAGFRVLNPHAERSCGCGKSFEPAKKAH